MRAVSRGLLSVVAAVAVAAACQPAKAGMVTLGFTNLSNTSGQAASVATQLKAVVATDAVDLHSLFPTVYADVATNEFAATASGFINVIFVNLGPINSSIADVYIDDGTLFGIATITDSGAGVEFAQGVTPPNFPGRNAVTPEFVTSQAFSVDSNEPVSTMGVNPGEWLAIKYQLINGKTYDDTFDALQLEGTNIDNYLRIGLHVQSIGDGPSPPSDSFINLPPADVNVDGRVPEPASIVLAAMGGLGAVVMGRRRREQAA